MQLVVSIAIACRSPPEPLPPSIGAFNGTAYGPGSLSSSYRNVAGYFVCAPVTVTNGMPIGPPFQVPDPKSAWKPVAAPMVFTIVVEFDSTGSVSTGVFQMLLAGSTVQGPSVCCAHAV